MNGGVLAASSTCRQESFVAKLMKDNDPLFFPIQRSQLLEDMIAAKARVHHLSTWNSRFTFQLLR